MKTFKSQLINISHKIKWLLTQLTDFKILFVIIVILSILTPFSGVSSAWLTKLLIDQASSNQPFFKYLLALLILLISSTGLEQVYTYFSSSFSSKMYIHLQHQFVAHYISIKWEHLKNHKVGDQLTRLTQDTYSILETYTDLIPGLLTNIFDLVLSVALVIYFDPLLALYGLILGPLLGLLGFYWSQKMMPLEQALKENEGVYQTYAIETIQFALLVKVFQAKNHILSKLKRVQSKRHHLQMQQTKYHMLSSLTSGTGVKLSYLIAFTWGAYGLYSGRITFGSFAAFLQLFSRIQGPIMSIGKHLPSLLKIMNAVERYRAYDTLQSDTQHECDIITAPSIHFKGVSFGYEAEHLIIDDMTFCLKHNEVTLIIGPSGIGKTTLLRLLLGLVTPQRGHIYLESSDGKHHDLNLNTFAYVPQGNTLFSASIRENLLLGNPSSSDEDLYIALEAACISSHIKDMPDQLNAIVGQQHNSLSEGQAQRICIARALLREAPILLLDEATSSLDQQTEDLILRNILSTYPHKTLIIVSHREKMIGFADRLLDLSPQ